MKSLILTLSLLSSPKLCHGFSPHMGAALTVSSLHMNGSPISSNSISTDLQCQELGKPVCTYHQVTIPTTQEGPPRQAISVEDLTPTIEGLLAQSGMNHGSINIISRHTTTAIIINESESRLAEDMSTYFTSLVPPDERSSASTAQEGVRYYHNDIDQRPDSDEEAARCRENGWDIDDPERLQAWRDQEPINAHSHLISMLLGSSETIPVVNGKMVIGQVRIPFLFSNCPRRLELI